MQIKNLPDKFKPIWEKALALHQREGRPGDDLHAKEVVEFMLNYKGDLNLDFDVLVPTAMMHDIGHTALLPEHLKYVTGTEKLLNAKLVHMLAGAKIAKQILEETHYDSEKTKEIVEIISMHDIDQLKNIDAEKFYNTENKKIFHDIDILDRFSKERIDSTKGLALGMTKSERLNLLRKMSSFFHKEIEQIADKKFRKLEQDFK